MLRAMKLLREALRTWNTNWPTERVKRVLVAQSGSPGLFLDILRAVQERFGGAEIHVAIHDYCLPYLSPDHTQRFFLVDRNDKLGFIRRMRRNAYDTVVICVTGEPDFWKLKLMGFCLRAKQVLCYNEHGGGFVCNRWHRAAVLKHLRYRLSRSSPGRRSFRITVLSRFLRVSLGGVAFLVWMLRATIWEMRRLVNTGIGYAARK